MPVFKDADELYSLLGRLFEQALADPDLGPRVRAVDTILQLRLRRPDSLVTIRALAEEEPAVEMGITELRPEVTMLMEADTAHGLWLGQVNPADALARGRIRAAGPVVKILAIVPLIASVRDAYRTLLTDAGRDDLAGPAPQVAAESQRAAADGAG